MSATHKTLLWRNAHHAQIGVQRGENGVVGNLGAALETAVIKVDLPALGMPSRPTSASTLSSSCSSAHRGGQQFFGGVRD